MENHDAGTMVRIAQALRAKAPIYRLFIILFSFLTTCVSKQAYGVTKI